MHITPMATRRNDKLVNFILIKISNIFTVLFLCKQGFFIVCVRDAFEEKDRNNICLVFVLVDRATQNIARLKKMQKQFLAGCFGSFYAGGCQIHICRLYCGFNHRCSVSRCYFRFISFGGGCCSNTTRGFFHERRINIFKINKDFQQSLVQKGECVFSNIRRNSIIRFRNTPSDSGKSVAIAAYGNGVSDRILKICGFQECHDCLRYGILAGFVKFICSANTVKCEIHRIIVLINVIVNLKNTFALTRQINSHSSSFCSFDSFWVVVRYFCDSF